MCVRVFLLGSKTDMHGCYSTKEVESVRINEIRTGWNLFYITRVRIHDHVHTSSANAHAMQRSPPYHIAPNDGFTAQL